MYNTYFDVEIYEEEYELSCNCLYECEVDC